MKCLFALALLALPAACRRAAAPVPDPRPGVEVVRAEFDSVPNRMSFVGMLSSNFDAVIEPRINGYLLGVHFSAGVPVRRGQLLFTIDPSLLSTTLLAAQANLESARAQALSAKNDYERAVPLARIHAISQTQFDQYTAQHAATQAAVRAAEQQLRNAQLEVSYTRIYAPIDGIIASSDPHRGDYVGVGTKFAVLTTISNVDTMAVDVSIPMAQYLRYAGVKEATYDNAGLLSNIVLTLADGSRYPYAGFYSYTRRDIADGMGSIVLVVKFPNPQYTLKPGQFARITTDVGRPTRAVLVPQEAVSQIQGIDAVWVVDRDTTARQRIVELGRVDGRRWVVHSGVEAGELVVTSGVQHLRNGEKVRILTR